ncbi:hypothetical protein SADUNF_Sadunf15G0047700 [Salix dunnii]|uniref:Uncharacterized protein n=1 Tax=Salix dunnii TaxID=1413687 RepID=A0A835MKZ1_9ROSI|nr:hypothetical protein SADUNF_Sadunf15G0047700 [Salix dunnii]
MPQSDPCSGKADSKLGFISPRGKILDSTIPFNKLLETEFTESADTASPAVFAFVSCARCVLFKLGPLGLAASTANRNVAKDTASSPVAPAILTEVTGLRECGLSLLSAPPPPPPLNNLPPPPIEWKSCISQAPLPPLALRILNAVPTCVKSRNHPSWTGSACSVNWGFIGPFTRTEGWEIWAV